MQALWRKESEDSNEVDGTRQFGLNSLLVPFQTRVRATFHIGSESGSYATKRDEERRRTATSSIAQAIAFLFDLNSDLQ